VEVGWVVALQCNRVQCLEVRKVTKDGVAGGVTGVVLPVGEKESQHGPVPEIPECIRSGLAVEDDVEVHLVRRWTRVGYGVAEVKVVCVSVLRAFEADCQR